jgi:phage-related protein
MSKNISLSQGKTAQVDDDMYAYLSQWKWFCTAQGYAVRHTSRKQGHKSIFMHREIMKAPVGMDVDHRDGDGLNNQRSNLRVCTHQQNMHNTKLRKTNSSGYRGVYWNKMSRKWQAYIRHDGQQQYLGVFVDIKDAARAYDHAARKFRGEFASTNFANEGGSNG